MINDLLNYYTEGNIDIRSRLTQILDNYYESRVLTPKLQRGLPYNNDSAIDQIFHTFSSQTTNSIFSLFGNYFDETRNLKISDMDYISSSHPVKKKKIESPMAKPIFFRERQVSSSDEEVDFEDDVMHEDFENQEFREKKKPIPKVVRKRKGTTQGVGLRDMPRDDEGPEFNPKIAVKPSVAYSSRKTNRPPSRSWQPDEDVKLMMILKTKMPPNFGWKGVANRIPGRNVPSCQSRYRILKNMGSIVLNSMGRLEMPGLIGVDVSNIDVVQDSMDGIVEEDLEDLLEENVVGVKNEIVEMPREESKLETPNVPVVEPVAKFVDELKVDAVSVNGNHQDAITVIPL